MLSVSAYNGTSFKPHQTMLLNIPCGRRGHYLNTRMFYLRFKIVNTHATVPLALDFSAAGLIQSLAIYHGSNLLEQINEYNALYHLFVDLQGSTESVTRAGSILMGTHANTLRSGVTVASNNGEAYVCIPIMSGIVGPLQSKYLPTGVITGGDLRLELTLASRKNGRRRSSGRHMGGQRRRDGARVR